MFVIERAAPASPTDQRWLDDPLESGWEIVDGRPFEEWKADVLADAPGRCPECGGPLASDDDTDDDNWSDVDAEGYWCEGEVVRRHCASAYDLPWTELHRSHPSTLGELVYERVVHRAAVRFANVG